MSHCPHCGFQSVAESDNFCRNCGYNLKATSSKKFVDWQNTPFVVTVTVIASIIVIFIFITGYNTLTDATSDVKDTTGLNVLPDEAKSALFETLKKDKINTDHKITSSKKAQYPQNTSNWDRDIPNEVWCVTIEPSASSRWGSDFSSSRYNNYLLGRFGLDWRVAETLGGKSDFLEVGCTNWKD
jgi:hypothetical protein